MSSTSQLNSKELPAQDSFTKWIGVGIEFCQLMVIGLLLELLLFEGTEVIWLIRLSVIAALLAGILKSQGWFVLLALQCSLFIREPRRTEMYFGIAPLLFVVTALAIIAYSYWGRSVRTRISAWIIELLQAREEITPTVTVDGQEKASSSQYWLKFFGIQLVSWLVIVCAMMVTLQRLPLSANMRSEWFRSSVENEFTAWPGATLLVVALLIVVIFMEAGWRQMTSAQARAYLRSSFVLYHYRDLRMIVLRRLKLKRSAANPAITKKSLAIRNLDAPPKI